jgi:hypothetical protein
VRPQEVARNALDLLLEAIAAGWKDSLDHEALAPAEAARRGGTLILFDIVADSAEWYNLIQNPKYANDVAINCRGSLRDPTLVRGANHDYRRQFFRRS